MKRFARILTGFLLISCAAAGTALATRVTIDPAAYRGQWTVDYGDAQRGPVVVALAAGAHVVSLGGAELLFNVAADGTVTVDNGISATGGVGSLTFNTVTVKVDPVCFTGRWRVTDRATPNFRGTQAVTLVRGLDFYALEVGATGGFFFGIQADGTVTIGNDVAARGGAFRPSPDAEQVGILKFKGTDLRFGCP